MLVANQTAAARKGAIILIANRTAAATEGGIILATDLAVEAFNLAAAINDEIVNLADRFGIPHADGVVKAAELLMITGSGYYWLAPLMVGALAPAAGLAGPPFLPPPEAVGY